MKSATGAGWYFSASHYDEIRRETHGHSYEVVAWWASEPYRDGVALQHTLRTILERGFDHKTLPPELSTAEALAKAIGGLMVDCIGVDVSRPVERLHARWRA
jgi:6-pyruvoyl-tetrahydropterin synthase